MICPRSALTVVLVLPLWCAAHKRDLGKLEKSYGRETRAPNSVLL